MSKRVALAFFCVSLSVSSQSDELQWHSYGNDHTEQRFSTAAQVNTENVEKLGLDWSFDVPDAVSLNSTPLMVNGVLYFSADRALVHAVDARTGALLWTYDPQSWKHAPRGIAISFNTNRGIAHYQNSLFVGTADGRLVSLDAKTGVVNWATRTFGRDERKAINGAPRAFDGKVFIGNSGAEFGTRGFVSAYDANSGEMLWRFYTVPGNPADGFENEAMARAAKTWHGEWWKVFGGGTVWNAMTYDPESKLLYIGVGNGDPWDHDLRSQGKGDNLYLCSIVALKADTGEYVWHYQLNPGEQWDYKATADMILAQLPIRGKQRKVIMQAPTNGFFYVLDRATGELLSAEKFEKATWAERIDLKTGRPVEVPGIRMKPGEEKLIHPGPYGAHNWQAMSFNPRVGLAYIPTMRYPAIYSKNAAYEQRDNFFVIGMNTVYATPEPGDGQGGLVAWDPVTQKSRWTVKYESIWNGGTLTTAGGLVFHGTADGLFFAYDAQSGAPLWEFDAQRGIAAAPISYTLDGQQHIALPVGGGGQSAFGPPAFRKHAWKYKGPGIRLLSFSLNGKRKLPEKLGSRFEFNPVDTGEDPIDRQLAQRGFDLYHQSSCAVCHGGEVISVGAAAPDLRESVMTANYKAFRAVVVEGALLQKSMPMFDDFTEGEVRALFEYVRSQARIAE
ncbi:MAG: PQQ-dependent dehydrogenase, methanol/ethanol family [Pseudomonadales bacterium]